MRIETTSPVLAKSVVEALRRYATPRAIEHLGRRFRAGPNAVRMEVLESLECIGSDDVLFAHEDSKRLLWVGTNRGGLNRLEAGKMTAKISGRALELFHAAMRVGSLTLEKREAAGELVEQFLAAGLKFLLPARQILEVALLPLEHVLLTPQMRELFLRSRDVVGQLLGGQRPLGFFGQ